MRKFRYIEEGHGKDSLSFHEEKELLLDFDISTVQYYVLAPLTKEEWERILKEEGEGK